MSSTKNRRAVIVGIVLALGLLIFMVAVFTLGGQKKAFTSTISTGCRRGTTSGFQA
jgi:phospholipid/cholesterol/gamma-HCH transport system substrate-binding protein